MRVVTSGELWDETGRVCRRRPLLGKVFRNGVAGIKKGDPSGRDADAEADSFELGVTFRAHEFTCSYPTNSPWRHRQRSRIPRCITLGSVDFWP